MSRVQIAILCLAVSAAAVASIYVTTREEGSENLALQETATSTDGISAYYGQGPDDVDSEDEARPVPPAAAQAARKRLAEEQGIPENEIEILTSYRKQWGNACLESPRDGEVCAQMITSGYEVTMQADGITYVYRTDGDGSQIRFNTVLGG